LSRQLARLAWLGDETVANNNQVLRLLSANRIIAGGHRDAARLTPHADSGQVPGPQRGSKPHEPVIAFHRIDRAHSIRKRCEFPVNWTRPVDFRVARRPARIQVEETFREVSSQMIRMDDL
jgi:hypothetical protein